MGDGEPRNQDPAWENLASKPPIIKKKMSVCLVGKSCGKILRENLVGQGGVEKANLRKAVIGGNLVFGVG